LNATQAAIRSGYSEKTAKQAGHENLTKPDIALEIQKAMQERGERTGITADQVIREIERMAVTREAICIGVLLFRYFPSP
jgi:phage terminase small subunit